MADFELGAATLGTQVDTDGLDKGIDSAEKKAKGGFLNIASIMEGALGGALFEIGKNIATSVGGFIAGGLEDARGSAQLMASTEQTIKTMGNAAGRSGEQIADMAAALSDASGKSLFGDDQIQESENLLLTFGEIKGATFDAATALTVDLAAALGGEPKQQAMMLGKALNDPIHGISALGKAGLTFSEEQKAMIASLQQGGDMAGAQAIIIAELNKQVGGQAAAQAAAAGGMVQFQARMGELAETLATALLPILDQLAMFLNDPLMPILETAATWIGENLPPMIDAAVASVTNFTGGLSGILTTMQPVIDMISANMEPILAGLATVLAVVVIPAFVAWATAAGTAAIATITALAPVVIPIAAIGAAVAVLFAAWENDWGGIRTTIETFWNTTGKPIFDQLKAWLSDKIPVALKALADMWNNVLWPALQKVWSFIDANVLPILSALVTVGLAVVKKEVELLSALWSNVLWPALQKVWQFINDPLVPILEKLAGVARDTLGPAFSWLNDNILSPIITALGNINTAVQGVIGFFGDLARSIDAIEIPSWLQGHSPPPLANWLGAIGDEMHNVQLLAADLTFPNATLPSLASTNGGAGVHITLEERGLRDLIRVTVREELNTAGRSADTRNRTGL